MRSSYVLPAALAALANALPQSLDMAAIAALQPAPTPTIPIVSAAAQVTTVSAAASVSSAINSISASIAASGVAAASTAVVADKVKRQAISYTDESPAAFQADPTFASIAAAAPTPSGYTMQFEGLLASNNAYGYMGYTVLDEYDPVQCANDCNNIAGCASINIYFERDPVTDPTSENPNPPSEAVIKCVFWSGPVTTANAVNDGQWRDDFQVVMAGSNGYMNSSIVAPAGFSDPVPFGDAAINAPLGDYGVNTYITYQLFTGYFDAKLCTAACKATSAFDIAQGLPTEENPNVCTFVNTYIISENNQPLGQVCAMYTQTWDASYAVNTGYTWEDDVYTISMSYGYSVTPNL